jgi:hypothetical protein
MTKRLLLAIGRVLSELGHLLAKRRAMVEQVVRFDLRTSLHSFMVEWPERYDVRCAVTREAGPI